MQTKLSSFLESVLNVGTGFLTSVVAWQFIIAPWFGFDVNFKTNLQITALFTIISVIRGFIWRRIFNYYESRKHT